jgi:acetoin utilization protein AcuB
VEVDAPLLEAHDLMIDHEIRHLPVVEAGRLVGVVSDRDIAAVDNDGASQQLMERLRVRDVCTLDFYAVPPEEPLDAVLEAMAERRLGSAIVTEGEKIAGLFTATDACRVFAEHLRAAR